VVSTNIGALPDLVEQGKNGYLAPPGDSQQLAQYLIELLDDPAKCQRFGEAGRQIAQDRYSWDAVGERFKAHISSVLG